MNFINNYKFGGNIINEDFSGNDISNSKINKKDSSNNIIPTKPPPKNMDYEWSDGLFATIKEIFSLTNIIFFLWFLLIYYVIFYLVRSFYKNDSDPFKEKLALSRGIDIFIYGLIIILIVYSYWLLSEDDKTNLIGYLLNFTQEFYNNPNTFFNCFIFIIIFYCFIYLCGVPMTKETQPTSIYFIEQKLWILLITVIIIDFFIYILGIPIVDMIFGINGGLVNNWYNLKSSVVNKFDDDDGDKIVAPPHIDVSNNKPVVNIIKDDELHKQIHSKKPEVFNISNNLYTYDDANSVCKAFDSRLATVDEVNESYEEGAEWCVSSWSADQHVLYPTQKETYDRLQKIKGSEDSCGRTGVNGGRMKDTSLRFGANCYGIKPPPSELDKIKMNNISNYVPPKSKEDMILDAKVNFWKKNKDKYTAISPFNNEKWSYES